jgi:hypothetical protein
VPFARSSENTRMVTSGSTTRRNSPKSSAEGTNTSFSTLIWLGTVPWSKLAEVMPSDW